MDSRIREKISTSFDKISTSFDKISTSFDKISTSFDKLEETNSKTVVMLWQSLRKLRKDIDAYKERYEALETMLCKMNSRITKLERANIYDSDDSIENIN